MKPKTLGVLVTSEKHGAHLPRILYAAERKNIALAIHLQGDGVRLCLQKRYEKVLNKAHLSICRRSAEALGLADHLQTIYPKALAPDRTAAMRINECTRNIVL